MKEKLIFDIKDIKKVPRHKRLMTGAYFPAPPSKNGLNNALRDLAELALEERWDFDNLNENYPYPILHSYIIYTFSRLIEEDKVTESTSKNYAAFNTGPVDETYESIYDFFEKNRNERRQSWIFKSFCISAEDKYGKELVSQFKERPQTPSYFDNPLDLIV